MTFGPVVKEKMPFKEKVYGLAEGRTKDGQAFGLGDVVLFYVPSQQLWSCEDGQFT